MSNSARGFARSVKSRQRLPHVMGARVDGTGTAALLSGSTEMTLTDNGVGDYSLTFATAFARVPVVVATPLTTNVYISIAAVSATAVQLLVKQVADGTTATDADFHVMVFGSDAADEV